MTTIITTTQAPDAKPVGLSVTLSESWDPIIEVPSYSIPELVFGGTNVTVPGVGEIITPLIIANRDVVTVDVSVRIYRASSNSIFYLANEIPIPSFDVLSFPMNGQFIYTGDILEMKATSNNSVDVTISYTVGQAEQDDVV